jgi:flagellar motor switch protein FliG
MTEAVVLTLPGVTPPAPPKPAARAAGLSRQQKAAVLVLQLGKEASAPVLAELSEIELERLSTEVAHLGAVEPELAEAVLEEFALAITADSPGLRGGLDAARGLLDASIDPDRAEAIAERVSQNFVSAPFSFLQKLDARQVVSFLADEHPQTIALVLAHLPADLASRVLAGLGSDLQASVAHRIAVMDRTTPEIIRQVEESLERRLLSLHVASDLSAVGGLRPLVEIINRSDRGTERLILEGLEAIDPDLAEQVKAQMFRFEDIVTLDDRSVQLVLRQVQVNELATALKGTSEAVRNKIMQNMSERAALSLAEEIDLLGPVRVNVVEESQAGVVRVIRKLEEEGQITISRGEDDAFVA